MDDRPGWYDRCVWESALHDYGVALENRSGHKHGAVLREAKRDAIRLARLKRSGMVRFGNDGRSLHA